MSKVSPQIGTLGEKPLHASLKQWYAVAGARIEVAVDDFVVDIVQDELLIEVQTRGFSSIRDKLIGLLDGGHRVRIVYPIPVDKWIIKIDDAGSVISRRRSPKHGKPCDIFTELVSFPELMARQRLEIELALVEEEEIRRHTPGRSWRRKGWSVLERRLVEVRQTVLLCHLEDLTGLMPSGLPEAFTTADLAERLGSPRRTAQQMAYCLRRVGLIKMVGKRGNAHVYEQSTS